MHLSVGQFGWLSRYEIYAWGTILLMLIHVYGVKLSGWAESQHWAALASVMGLGLLVLCYPYVQSLYRTPFQARQGFEVHYQLNRFVTQYYVAPVATSDLGWVSFRNSQYVLDFGGLASKEAQEHYRKNDEDPTWMNNLADRYNVRLALVYPEWYQRLPVDWIPVAQLGIRKGRFARPEQVLTFFALDHETAAEFETPTL